MKYDEFYKLCEKVYEPITNFEKSCLPLCAAENEQSEFTKIPLKSFIQDKYIMVVLKNIKNIITLLEVIIFLNYTIY